MKTMIPRRKILAERDERTVQFSVMSDRVLILARSSFTGNLGGNTRPKGQRNFAACTNSRLSLCYRTFWLTA